MKKNEALKNKSNKGKRFFFVKAIFYEDIHFRIKVFGKVAAVKIGLCDFGRSGVMVSKIDNKKQ